MQDGIPPVKFGMDWQADYSQVIQKSESAQMTEAPIR